MHVTDDRGRLVKRLTYAQLRPWPSMPSPIPLEARTQIAAQANKAPLKGNVLVPIGLGCGFTVIWSLMLLMMLLGGGVSPSSPIALVLWFCVVPVLVQLVVIGVSAWSFGQRTASIICANGHCASCGYALAILPTEADGCTVCPECGSAWRIPAAKDA